LFATEGESVLAAGLGFGATPLDVQVDEASGSESIDGPPGSRSPIDGEHADVGLWAAIGNWP